MAKPNATSPGRGQVATIGNNVRSGKVNTYTSETSGNTSNGRSSIKVRFSVI